VPELALQVERYSAVLGIGGVTVRVNTTDSNFLELLRERYSGFVTVEPAAEFEFDIELVESMFAPPEAEVSVRRHNGRWLLKRADFQAEWNPATRTATIRQNANAYSLDAMLRIVHTLVLAEQGGFLVHSASAIRNGKAFLFAGVSGAGKTTISRLAPPDATLLTDEISYLSRIEEGYVAFGTPFAGDLGKPGENVSAPVAALYLLAKGEENRIHPVSVADAGRELLSNMLFFAEDPELVQRVFQTACDFVQRVPVYRLTFVPDARVWEMIR
jgi:hypothetical protein